jgi:[ribosomal protein S18]-alanine N-acetyltransferase
VILRATNEDLSALARLEQDVFGPDAWTEQLLADELVAPGRVVLVAMDDIGALVGYATLLVVGDTSDLLRIAVARARQRRGVATELLDHAMRSARAEGAHHVLLEVSAENAAAVEFYRAHQFRTVDRRTAYYRDGSDALVMQRPL